MNIQQILKQQNYAFIEENEQLGNNIIFLTLAGSHAYGTNIETSDVDIRGCALPRKQELIGFSKFEQFEDQKTDTTIYCFNKLVQLLLNCNPNIIELLGCKSEHYAKISPIGQQLLDNKKIFLSQKAKESFVGYATAQLRRLQNAIARDALLSSQKETHILNSIKSAMNSFHEQYQTFGENQIQLYIGESKTVDQETEILLDMNLKGYPLRDCKGILAKMNDIIKVYDKLNHRNTKKDDLHLNKHAMHLVRLYLMAIDLFEKEEIITYRTDDLELLMSIRMGKYMNEDKTYHSSFFELINDCEKRMDYAMKQTSLPQKPDLKTIEEFVIAVHEQVIRGEY